MRITLAAVGRAKAGPSRDLYDLYAARLTWRLTLKEIEERRGATPEEQRSREGQRLLSAVPSEARLIVLDETGRHLTSADLAAQLGRWRDAGVKELAVVVGGAEGLSQAVRERADLVLALGTMTWPHILVRALIVEQLYRAQTILSGHPYHRT